MLRLEALTLTTLPASKRTTEGRSTTGSDTYQHACVSRADTQGAQEQRRDTERDDLPRPPGDVNRVVSASTLPGVGRPLDLDAQHEPTTGSERRYRTIMADPPWDHSDGTGYVVTVGDRTTRRQRTDGGYTTAPPYAAMTLDAIRSLPVADWAEDDAHLYLWTTNRYLRDVWDVAEAWGFKGVCIITWAKAYMGALGGGAWQSNTEFCLFARRGSLPTVGQARGRWYDWPRRRGAPVREGERRQTMHSAKPEGFIDLVEQVSPGPYLEMFARRARFGWDYYGDESLSTAEVAA